MTTTTETKDNTLSEAFTLLTKHMKNRQRHQEINAHCIAKHGLPVIALHGSDEVGEDEKLETYRECLEALASDNYSKLQGEVPKGQVKGGTEKPAEKAPEKPEKKPEPSKAGTSPEPKPEPKSNGQGGGNKDAEQLVDILGRLVGSKAGKAEVDEEKVREIVKEEVGKIDVTPKAWIEVTLSDGSTVAIDEVTHWQGTQVAQWLKADVGVWLWGQPGGGKTSLFYQVAKMLGTTAKVVSVDPTMTVAKLVGYRNLVNGEFVEGFLYGPYKNGGLFCLDEIDTGDPSIIASINAALSNGHYLFPNGETVERHRDFRFIAGANTKGTGAVAGFTARNRLDAATLDRFAIIEMKYDEALERICSGIKTEPTKPWTPGKPAGDDLAKKWVDYVQACRKEAGDSVLISPRASIMGVRALKAGVPPEEVADAVLFKLTTSDTKRKLVNQVGKVPGT